MRDGAVGLAGLKVWGFVVLRCFYRSDPAFDLPFTSWFEGFRTRERPVGFVLGDWNIGGKGWGV